MDPTTVFCPNLACPARGAKSARATLVIHSRQDTRFLCTACHKTFSATPGTVFSRLRPWCLSSPCSPMGLLCKRSWRRVGLTSGRPPIGGHAPGDRGRPCTWARADDHG